MNPMSVLCPLRLAPFLFMLLALISFPLHSTHNSPSHSPSPSPSSLLQIPLVGRFRPYDFASPDPQNIQIPVSSASASSSVFSSLDSESPLINNNNPIPLGFSPLSGCAQLDFTATVTIGSQSFSLIVDTGSATVAVASPQCSTCGVTPTYSPSPSSLVSSSLISSTYGDGSGWTGHAYRDVLSVGSSSPIPLVIANIESEKNFFKKVSCQSNLPVGRHHNGILGMAFQKISLGSTEAYWEHFTHQNPKVKPQFSMQLCSSTGSLWLGGYDPSALVGPIQWTSVVTDEFWNVHWSGVSVGGIPLQLSAEQLGPAIVDSGSTAFVVNSLVFNGIIKILNGNSAWTNAFGEANRFFTSGRCVIPDVLMTSQQLNSILPVLSIRMGQLSPIELKMNAVSSYLLLRSVPGSPPTYCPSMEMSSSPSAIFGFSIINQFTVIFDSSNTPYAPYGRVGFATANYAHGCQQQDQNILLEPTPITQTSTLQWKTGQWICDSKTNSPSRCQMTRSVGCINILSNAPVDDLLSCEEGGKKPMDSQLCTAEQQTTCDSPSSSPSDCAHWDCGAYGDCFIQNSVPQCVCSFGFSGNHCGQSAVTPIKVLPNDPNSDQYDKNYGNGVSNQEDSHSSNDSTNIAIVCSVVISVVIIFLIVAFYCYGKKSQKQNSAPVSNGNGPFKLSSGVQKSFLSLKSLFIRSDKEKSKDLKSLLKKAESETGNPFQRNPLHFHGQLEDDNGHSNWGEIAQQKHQQQKQQISSSLFANSDAPVNSNLYSSSSYRSHEPQRPQPPINFVSPPSSMQMEWQTNPMIQRDSHSLSITSASPLPYEPFNVERQFHRISITQKQKSIPTQIIKQNHVHANRDGRKSSHHSSHSSSFSLLPPPPSHLRKSFAENPNVSANPNLLPNPQSIGGNPSSSLLSQNSVPPSPPPQKISPSPLLSPLPSSLTVRRSFSSNLPSMPQMVRPHVGGKRNIHQQQYQYQYHHHLQPQHRPSSSNNITPSPSSSSSSSPLSLSVHQHQQHQQQTSSPLRPIREN